MSRPRDPGRQRWTIRESSIGYIDERNGKARLRIKYGSVDIRKTLPFSFIEENRKLGEKILRDHLMPILFPELAKATPQPEPPPLSLAMMQVEYKRIKGGEWTDNIKKLYKQSFDSYFNGYSIAQPFVYESFFDHLVLRNEELATRLADSTRLKRMQYVSAFCSFAVRRGWMPENPIVEIGLPDRVEPEEVAVYEWHEELDPVIGYHRERSLDMTRNERDRRSSAMYADTFHLLRLTAMREGEVIRQKLTDIKPDLFTIEGKRTRAKIPKRRDFPLTIKPGTEDTLIGKWLQDIRDTLNRLIAYGGFRDGHLVPWSHPAAIQRALVEAKEAKNIPLDDRAVHTIRKTALEYWETTLGIDWVAACDLAGHNPAVKFKYYRKRRRAMEIAESLSRSAEQSVQTANEPKLIELVEALLNAQKEREEKPIDAAELLTNLNLNAVPNPTLDQRLSVKLVPNTLSTSAPQ